MNYLLIIPSGGGLKTFLSTQFVDLLLETGEVHVWHALPEASIDAVRGQWKERVRWHVLPSYREKLGERTWRQARGHAQIHWRGGDLKEILLQRVRSSGAWWNRGIGAVAGGLGRVCAGAKGIAWLDSLHERSSARSAHAAPFYEFLKELRPNAVFCGYQRAIRAVPAMAAARQLGIPTGTFIYSWDNLPKNRIAVPSDYYFVWSNWMMQELLNYYPSVRQEQIRVVGTPQFEHYSNQALIRRREEFLGSIGLDPARRVICFSGDDVKTSPHDPIYLGDLAKAVREMPSAKRPQILFRPCPTDRSGRFDSVLREYPEIVRSEPLWTSQGDADWSQVIPSKEDTALLMNVVFHCDLVVNLGSTMAMDFAVFDKPGVYIDYNPPTAGPDWNIEDVYRLPHFEFVHLLQPVYWAKSAGELGEVVRRALQCPQEKSEARQAWLRHQVQLPLDKASARCARALEEIAKGAEGEGGRAEG